MSTSISMICVTCSHAATFPSQPLACFSSDIDRYDPWYLIIDNSNYYRLIADYETNKRKTQRNVQAEECECSFHSLNRTIPARTTPHHTTPNL